MPAGMKPLSLFCEKSRLWSRLSFSNPGGIGPLRRLKLRLRVEILVQSERLGGMLPVREL